MSSQPHLKIGIDANRPIDPRTGIIQPQVADPDVIASTGTGWVRLNFVLAPWSSPHDPTLHAGRTWAQAYRHIIDGFRSKGLRIYGLIGCEAMPESPQDRFRDAPPTGEVTDEWLQQYAEQFVTIVELFHRDVPVFESFNEPDDWHGQDRNWIHPGWFAIMLQTIYAAVRRRPELDHVKIVSGPLQGLEVNRNAAVSYLLQTYTAGKQRFGWGQGATPFPFDGVGYHLYVRPRYEPNRSLRARAIRTTCRRYLGAMHELIRQQEGHDKPLYVSEVGWSSTIDYQEVQRQELFQAHCLQVGLETVANDPLVELGCWFCTQDFPSATHDTYYGLYRLGDPTPENRKPAYQAFAAVCQGVPAEEPEEVPFTNQEVINAFYRAAVELGLSDRWSLLTKAGLSLAQLAANRSAPYTGEPVELLPNLTDTERATIAKHLQAQVEGAGVRAIEAAQPVEDLSLRAGDRELDAQLDAAMPAAMQAQILEELRQNRETLERLLQQVSTLNATLARARPILRTAALIALPAVAGLVLGACVWLAMTFLR